MIGKVKLGSQVNKISKLNLSHDVNGTATFGHVFPLTSFHMVAKSKLNTKLNSVVRLSPMKSPTFGRVFYKVFSQFVHFKDIYEPYENFYTGKSYSTSETSYIPSELPSVTPNDLWLMLQKYACFTAYEFKDIENGYVPVNDSMRYANIWRSMMTKFVGDDRDRIEFFTEHNNPSFNYEFPNRILPTGADFVIKHSPTDNVEYVLCYRLTNEGKRLHKVLTGLGYKVEAGSEVRLNAIPLFAYAKCYFDLFAPQRETTWTDTPFYKVLEVIRTYDSPRIFDTHAYTLVTGYSDSLRAIFDFLANTYYTDNQDYYSAHIDKPSLVNREDSISFNSPNSFSDESLSVFSNQQPNLENTLSQGLDVISSTALQLLGKISRLRNIETALGGRVKELMKVLTGRSELHNVDSVHVANFSVPIIIDEIMSTNQMQNEVLLGQFAGQGKGTTYNMNLHCSYEADADGILIVLATIVPNSGYCQGYDAYLENLHKYEVYNGSFDSLGYDITQKDEITSQDVYSTARAHTNGSFGFKPRYFEYKTHKSRLLGDMALRSTRDTMQQYTLDRIISIDDFRISRIETTTTGEPVFEGNIVRSDVPRASEEWRYINKFPWMGNFDRIFPESIINPHWTDERQLLFSEDPFIVHNFIDADYYAPMLPCAESFDTEANNDSNIEVIKS